MGLDLMRINAKPRVTIFNSTTLLIKNLFSNRNLLNNRLKDFKNTYHGHFLGYGWSLLEPLIFTGIFYMIIVVLRGSSDDILPLNIMLGILPTAHSQKHYRAAQFRLQETQHLFSRFISLER